MNFGFDDDQEGLLDAARHVLATESSTLRTRQCLDDPEAWRAQWKTVTELGWSSLIVSEEAGGLGLGPVELIGLVELTGRWVFASPFVTTAAMAVPLITLLHPEARDRALERVVAGGVIAPAIHGPDGSVDDPCAGVVWNGHVLSGRKSLVTDAQRADHFVVTVTTPTGPGVALVPLECASVSPSAAVDPNRPVATVSFADVELDGNAVVTVDPEPALDVARAALAAEMVGVCDGVIQMAVEHATSRVQFGQPIGAFQAVKHKLAEAFVATERARTLTYNAAMVLADNTSDNAARAVASSMAKAAASEAAVRVAKAGVQVFGALAMTWEHDLHLFTRRARLNAALLGDHHLHYTRVGRSRLGEAS